MVKGIFSLDTVYGKTITNTIFNLNIRKLDLIPKLFNYLSRSILLLFDVSKNCCVRDKQCKPSRMRRLIWVYTVWLKHFCPN